MVQVLLPARLLQEAAACAALGAALGAARAFLPVRGRAAFAPDMLLSGAVLLACQSYAAGYSKAGVLRWYMVAAAFTAALCTAGHPAAGAGAGDTGCFAPAQPYFAPFCGAACAPPPRCVQNHPQITPERRKNRKKIQKELAKPAGIVV